MSRDRRDVTITHVESREVMVCDACGAENIATTFGGERDIEQPWYLLTFGTSRSYRGWEACSLMCLQRVVADMVAASGVRPDVIGSGIDMQPGAAVAAPASGQSSGMDVQPFPEKDGGGYPATQDNPEPA